MQNQRARYRTAVRWAVVCLSMLGCLNDGSAFAGVFSDLSVTELSEKRLCLFAGQEITDIATRVIASDVLEIDLPDCTFSGGPKIVLAPHAKIKFLRINQVGRQPDIVRVAAVFEPGLTFVPKLENKRIILDQIGEAPKRPLVTAMKPVPLPPKKEFAPEKPAGYVAEKIQEPISLKVQEPVPSKPREYVVPENTVEPVPDKPRESVQIAPAASAPEASRAAVSAAEREFLDQKVSIQFEQQELTTILDALAQKFGLRVFADGGVKGKYTVHAVDMPLRDVLKSLLLQKNFQYTLRGKDLTVISLGQHADRVARELLFKDLGLKDALQTLSKMMNVNLIIHESVQDKSVNFYVENLSLDELLELLISTNDLVMKPHNENTYIIMTKAEAKKFGNKQYKTFKLVNAKPAEVISMITGSKSLAEKIDTANMAVNDRINALSVYETPENLDLIAKVIENVDEKLKQAVIEVKLLEVNRSFTRELGIDLNNAAGVNIAVPDVTKIPTSYALGARLVMLENEGKAKVLSSPKIRAVHNKKATINIGKKIPVPYFRYEVASTTYLGYVPQTYKEYRDLDTGIQLDVTPEISHDNEISLDINLKIDEVVKINDDGQPTRDSRSTHSYIRVQDGETVVLGGLITSQNTTDTSSPALINKIPLLKRLTSKTKNVKSDVEMIMLVTPRLVNLDETDEQPPEKSELVVQTRN